MYKVKKRNGEVVEFDIKKIEQAVEKAFDSVNHETTPDVLELIA